MGYETTIVFIETRHNGARDFCPILATVDMCKICCGEFGQLLSSKTVDESLQKLAEKYDDLQREVYTGDGDYTKEMLELSEEERNKRSDELFALGRELSKHLPYIFMEGGNRVCYTDRYGDTLIVTELDELEKALQSDYELSKKNIHRPNGYARYKFALDLIKSLKEAEGYTVKAVLYGH